jgi:hypothetical protein
LLGNRMLPRYFDRSAPSDKIKSGFQTVPGPNAHVSLSAKRSVSDA